MKKQKPMNGNKQKPLKTPEQMVEDMRKNKNRMPTKGSTGSWY